MRTVPAASAIHGSTSLHVPVERLLTYCLKWHEASSLAKPSVTACAHLAGASAGPYPFRIDTVLDEQGGITDAIVRCADCGQAYLIELIDWSGDIRERRGYRTSLIDDAVIERFKHNRRRGSCDVNRSAAEWFTVQAQARLTDLALTLDTRRAELVSAERLPADADVPMGHWRERLA
jgi:hypothetical protein